MFRPFLKIGLTFANLKALGNLFKDIERLQISVTDLARTLVPPFRNLPGSLSVLARVDISQNFKYIIFSIGSNSNFLVSPKWL